VLFGTDYTIYTIGLELGLGLGLMYK